MHDIQPSFSEGSKDSNSSEAKWKETLDKVAAAVVSVKFCHTTSFDAEDATSSEATGFVVDANIGYILTNRHVAGPNPFWGRCIFENHEEVDVYVIYYDPVHDFGILRYDPKSVKHMSLSAIPLRPDLVKVAEAVRLVGNDAGEKLSIQSAVISRLDRNAPEYDESGYNDFNTNYIQAASGATGGSSGSPVVNIHGQAVAMQAGNKSRTATDYFLPLDRPLRALQCLQKGEPITRGTIQCQWKFKPFNECQGLGLTAEWESELRKAFPNEVGVLVAERVIPQGPSDSKIQVGDILIKVNGKLLAQFKYLDDILDSSVGSNIELLLQRRGKDVEVNIEVADLFKITPDRLVSVAGASFQDLSYQRARAHGVACKGVYLCDSSGSFTPLSDGCLIQKVDAKATPDLDTFIEVMKTIPDQTRVVVTYTNLDDPRTPRFTILRIDRYWSNKITQYVKNDKTGVWDFTHLADAITRSLPVPSTASFVQLRSVPKAVADITKSIVKVECFVPKNLNGSYYLPRPSVGVVIDAEKGVILVSRATVPHALCDITITIADSVIVDGEVLFSHPMHHYALIRYDPLLVRAPLQSVDLSSKPVEQGASLHFVGFKDKNIGGPMYTRTAVTDVCNLQLEANPERPKLRAINSETLRVDTGLADDCGSGILMDDDGIVQALWLTSLHYAGYSDVYRYYGLATSTIFPVISRVRQGEVPKLRFLSVEFEAITMSQARDMKVSEEWIGKVEVANPSCHQLFKVKKRTIQSDDKSKALLEGDIVLTLNSGIITRLSELDINDDAESLDARVVRYGEEVNLELQTVLADDFETKRAVLFCGATLQPPHHAARLRVGKSPSEVFVSSVRGGSPASHYGLSAATFITHVNDTAARDLDSLLKAATTIPDNTNFTLTTMSLSGIEKVMKMRKNDHYFPTKEWIRATPKWIERVI
ncbi:trypsin-like serine protease [Hyaloscypha variabilis F]|uniref:Pro-apoptotic serine protease NMA111 n=1 Tax=Hyaloscypha variabilis (strain UAMH 11265 / GT02V1 / F) TaxID=1149755 RepID=A0A2J6RGY3_HYAVF|nr:trypsin-like serine protease [Hyaloscypha variabilis F]